MAEDPKMLLVQVIIVVYNLLEAFFAILCGWQAHSTALTGFGLDSMAESFGDLVLFRRIKMSGNSPERLMFAIKQKPFVFNAIFSFIFGSYILIQSIKVLILQVAPAPSLFGIIIAIGSLIFMPLLAFWSYHKHFSARIALKMSIKDIWAYMLLSFGLLLGLSANYYFGFWLADPMIGLVTVGFLYKKCLESLLGGRDNGNSSSTANDAAE
jgi:divalent metal cation (Fe/Co/Zn/Cd) transporter